MLNRVESTEYPRAKQLPLSSNTSTLITLAMDGLSQMSRLNARWLPIAEKCVEFVHVLSYLDKHDSLTRVLTQPSLTDDKLIQ